jgi:hypothetical protein
MNLTRDARRAPVPGPPSWGTMSRMRTDDREIMSGPTAREASGERVGARGFADE